MIGFMRETLLSEILDLSPAERVRLAQQIWESVEQLPDSAELSTEQRAELDRRLALFDKNPDRGIPWRQVLGRIREQG
jgi:putative addiction module component (TIGR02574 family)